MEKPLKEIEGIGLAKCPRCRRGDIFTGPAYSFKSQEMNKKCSHCGLTYEREPGYFYVSMFVSYAMVVAEMIAVAVLTYFITDNLESPWLYISVTLGTAVILSPFNYRYSRVVLLYWLTPGLNYMPDKANMPAVTKNEETKKDTESK